MSKAKGIKELERENADLVRVILNRKDAGAGATIKELTELVSQLRTEVTELRAKVENLKGKNPDLVEKLVKAEDDASDAKEALSALEPK